MPLRICRYRGNFPDARSFTARPRRKSVCVTCFFFPRSFLFFTMKVRSSLFRAQCPAVWPIGA